MKAYRVTLLVIDHEDLGEKEITDVLESTKYPNHCIAPDVKGIESCDIGEWRDDHPLNKRDECEAEYNRLFSLTGQKCDEIRNALKEALDHNQHDNSCAIFQHLQPIDCDCGADDREKRWKELLK